MLRRTKKRTFVPSWSLPVELHLIFFSFSPTLSPWICVSGPRFGTKLWERSTRGAMMLAPRNRCANSSISCTPPRWQPPRLHSGPKETKAKTPHSKLPARQRRKKKAPGGPGRTHLWRPIGEERGGAKGGGEERRRGGKGRNEVISRKTGWKGHIRRLPVAQQSP